MRLGRLRVDDEMSVWDDAVVQQVTAGHVGTHNHVVLAVKRLAPYIVQMVSQRWATADHDERALIIGLGIQGKVFVFRHIFTNVVENGRLLYGQLALEAVDGKRAVRRRFELMLVQPLLMYGWVGILYITKVLIHWERGSRSPRYPSISRREYLVLIRHVKHTGRLLAQPCH